VRGQWRVWPPAAGVRAAGRARQAGV